MLVKLAVKFWNKTERRGDDECWPWHGEQNNMGYGRIAFGAKKNRKRIFAHHAALLIHGFEVKGVVMHTCDNPNCVNPRHLRLGTQADNLADMRTKKRHNFGERNGMAKLTNEQVVTIKKLIDEGVSAKEIASLYSLSSHSIRDIKTGRRWGEVIGH